MAKNGKTVVRAIVERASPDRTNYKPYATDLTFNGNLVIEIPVDSEHVIEQKGEKIVLTAEGYASLLATYTKEIDKMNARVNKETFNPNQNKY